MEKYYRIEFTAKLEKMTLAFKMECDIQVFWKRGQKVAQTGKALFKNCRANFDRELTISCNMVFDTQKKLFKEKLTKFAIVIYTDKGNKQAGEVLFDVAPFLNERHKTKQYQLTLSKCPDKNSKLFFLLKASIIEQKTFDTISQSSLVSVDIQNLTGNRHAQISSLTPSANYSALLTHKLPPAEISRSDSKNASSDSKSDSKSSTSIMSKNKEKTFDLVPTTDRLNERSKKDISNSSNTERNENTAQMIKHLQGENKKIREQLKKKEQIKKQNEQLKKRLKDDDYESCKQYKKKIQQGKKQIQALVQQSKGAKKVNQDIKKLEKDILKCKQHIMRIFNDAEKFEPEAMDKIQQACGIKEY